MCTNMGALGKMGDARLGRWDGFMMDKMDIKEQFNLVAAEYDSNRRKFIPCFDDYYGRTTDFVAKSLRAKPGLIFDLGAGTGLLASFFYGYFPEADYVLVDIADEMLDVARMRFSGAGNVRYECLDYSRSLPEGKPDLITSALSIHHLEDDSKRALFRNIYECLGDGGVFVNYDQFCSENAETDAKVEGYWISGIQGSGLSEKEYGLWLERKKLDRECSVWQEVSWLKEAGFRNVGCVYWMGKFAVILAEK